MAKVVRTPVKPPASGLLQLWLTSLVSDRQVTTTSDGDDVTLELRRELPRRETSFRRDPSGASSEQSGIVQLRRTSRRVEMENEILRRAAYFAKGALPK